MSSELFFRPATVEDAPALATHIHEVSVGVVDVLLCGLIPGIGAPDVLTMVLRDTGSLFSFKNCVVVEKHNAIAGLLFAYPAEKQVIPRLMECMLSAARLEPVRELLTFSVSNSLYINTLWVDENLRGLGVADALMDYARTWALDAGKSALSLFAWRDNARAVAFYRKLGFIPVKTIVAQGALRERHDVGDVYALAVEAGDA